MKCKLRKIVILDFTELSDCKNYIKENTRGKLYLLNGKYRLIFKTDYHTNKYRRSQNTYLEYFKTLEYGTLIQDF